MTTDEYLDQVSRLSLAIENTLQDIQRLKDMATSITAPMDKERVQSSGTSDMVAKNVAEYVTLQQSENLKSCTELRNRIIRQINSMPNKRDYNILYKRYVLEIPISQIADALHIDRSLVYKDLHRALANFERIYGATYGKVHKSPQKSTLTRHSLT